MTDTTEPKTVDLKHLATVAETVAAEAEEAGAVRAQLEAAQAAFLDLVISTARPALRAIGTRPRVAWHVAHHADVNYRGGVRTEERYPSRCVCISDGQPGPMENTPGANSGTYHGGDLFLREDGALIALRYSGEWSRWQGSSWGWTAEITEYASPAKAIADGWDCVDTYVENLAAALEKAQGTRARAIAYNRALTEKLAAVVTLVSAKGRRS